MTRDELLARRLVLLRLYQNPASDEQAIEVSAELESVTSQLRDMPAEPRPTVVRSKYRGRRDGRSFAAGRDT